MHHREPKRPSEEEMRAYLRARPYVKCSRGGWVETYTPWAGMRWTFYPRDGRFRASDDFSLELAYDHAKAGRFEVMHAGDGRRFPILVAVCGDLDAHYRQITYLRDQVTCRGCKKKWRKRHAA